MESKGTCSESCVENTCNMVRENTTGSAENVLASDKSESVVILDDENANVTGTAKFPVETCENTY